MMTAPLIVLPVPNSISRRPPVQISLDRHVVVYASRQDSLTQLFIISLELDIERALAHVSQSPTGANISRIYNAHSPSPRITELFVPGVSSSCADDLRVDLTHMIKHPGKALTALDGPRER
jgi:hypothetical protein